MKLWDFATLAFLWLQFIWDKTYILYQITNALLIILARPLSFSLVAPWPPLVGLENVAPSEERNRFALAANFAHLRYPPTRQHTTCALFHSLRKELRAVSEGWLGRKGCRGIGNDLCRRDPRKPSLAGPSLLFKGSPPRCLGRSWPWAKILMKYFGPLWRRTL